MTEENKPKNYFKTFVSKYKFVVLTLTVIPILLGIACYFSVPFFNEAGSSAWLSFWGGYLGSTIMAGVTLYVLEQQLSQNHNENSRNRNNNKTENISNRELQLRILEFQQEQIWLDKFRQAAAHYLEIYSYNDLVEVSNISRENPNKAFYMVKDLISRAMRADLELAFTQRNSERFRKIDNDKTQLFILYNDILIDIQSLLLIRINNKNATLKEGLHTLQNITEEMRKIILQILEEMPNGSIENQLNTAFLMRINLIKIHEEKLRDCFYNYIVDEQSRINNILKIVNGTGQDK